MPSATPIHAPPPQMPGYLVDDDVLKDHVAKLLDRDSGRRFPGAQPVSFGREHIAELQQREYFMCEKTDGLRVLLFMHWYSDDSGVYPVTFLIDRKNHYYNVEPPLRIPYWQDPENPEPFLFDTILDGELVHDTYPGEPEPRLIYYVFDALVVDGKNVTKKGMDKRLGHMRDHALKPYNNYLAKHPPRGPHDYHPFRIKEKEMSMSYHLQHMFRNVLPTLKHGNDGLIFTCKQTPYEFGTDRHILKWKPPHENTIDFKLRLGEFPLINDDDGGEPYPDYNAKPTSLELYVQHNNNDYRFFAPLAVTDQEWEILKSLNQRIDGRIIECYRTPTGGEWKFKAEADGTPRWRDDKKDANHISTVNSVLASIENPVTEQDLLAFEPKIKEAVYRIQGRPLPPQQQQTERDAKKRKLDDANGRTS